MRTLTPLIRAISPEHYQQQKAEMDALRAIKAARWNKYDCREIAPANHQTRRDIEDRRLAAELGISMEELQEAMSK
ncbi:hypothetical protein ACET8O_20410 [Aeromonas veronii]